MCRHLACKRDPTCKATSTYAGATAPACKLPSAAHARSYKRIAFRTPGKNCKFSAFSFQSNRCFAATSTRRRLVLHPLVNQSLIRPTTLLPTKLIHRATRLDPASRNRQSRDHQTKCPISPSSAFSLRAWPASLRSQLPTPNQLAMHQRYDKRKPLEVDALCDVLSLSAPPQVRPLPENTVTDTGRRATQSPSQASTRLFQSARASPSLGSQLLRAPSLSSCSRVPARTRSHSTQLSRRPRTMGHSSGRPRTTLSQPRTLKATVSS